MRRLLSLLVGAVILIVASGCGERSPVLDPKAIPTMLAGLAAAPGGDRVYFLGETFGKLPLAAAERNEASQTFFIYGSCRNSGFGEGGCSPPVEVINQPWDGPWGAVQGCSRLESLRGVPTVRFGGGRGLFAGRPLTLITVDARNEEEELRAVAALRPIAGDSAIVDLPLPTASDLAGIDGACGANPGERGPELGAPAS
jgi:hypothetical protein